MLLKKVMKFLAAFDKSEPDADVYLEYLDWVTSHESTAKAVVICIQFFIAMKLPS